MPAKPSVPAATPPRKLRRDSRCSAELQAYVHFSMTAPLPGERGASAPCSMRPTGGVSPPLAGSHGSMIEPELHRRQQRPQVLLQRGGAGLARRLEVVGQVLALLVRR